MSKFVPPQGYEDDYDTLDYAIQLVSNLNASGRIDAIERIKLDNAFDVAERMMLEVERVQGKLDAIIGLIDKYKEDGNG